MIAPQAKDWHELDLLIDKMCDQILSADESAALSRLLADDRQALDHYIACMRFHGRLAWHMAPGKQLSPAELHRFTEAERDSSTGAVGCPSEPLLPVSPSLGFLSATFHGTIGYFSQEIPFSLLIAAVVTGLGLLIGSLISVSPDVEIARESVPPVAEPFQFEKVEYVGRITGTVDCKWADPNTAAMNGVKVRLGRKFTLASGLMEITYDTGAKVILQGPVTYEVESGNGGFLSVGKLTARVEKNEELRIKNEEVSASSSPLLVPRSYFAVRTPTATVTDLGTEFAVEVRETGGTSTHVFRGVVEVQPTAHDGHLGQPIRLNENESAQVENSASSQGFTVRRITADPAGYVRAEQLPKLTEKAKLKQKLMPFERWQAYSQELRRDPSLLAYYDCQQKDGLPTVLPNVAGGGDTSLDGVVENVTWSDGRMAGKHSLQFNSMSDYVRINLPKKVDDLTLAAWIQIQSFDKQQVGLLMSNGWGQLGHIHWGLTDDGRIALDAYDTSGRNWVYMSKPVFDHQRFYQWFHIAVVYDHVAGIVRFYADGKPAGEMKILMVTPLCIREARIGHWKTNGFNNMYDEVAHGFHGRIDELAIFGRVLKAEEIQRMCEAGK